MSKYSISSLFEKKDDKRMLAFAHRGVSLVYPENTFAAYALACELGTNLIELDVRLTADGKLVCIHDETVDRTTDGAGVVSELTLAQLQELDAGYRFKDANGFFLQRGKAHKIPTLEDVLRMLPDQYFSIELKDSSFKASFELVRLLRKLDAFDRVYINLIGMKSRAGRALRKLEPRIKTGHTVSEFVHFYALSVFGLSRFFKPKGIVFEIPIKKLGFRLVTKATVRAAHRLQIALVVWTVNDLDVALELENLGVDAVMTDSSTVIGYLRKDIE